MSEVKVTMRVRTRGVRSLLFALKLLRPLPKRWRDATALRLLKTWPLFYRASIPKMVDTGWIRLDWHTLLDPAPVPTPPPPAPLGFGKISQ